MATRNEVLLQKIRRHLGDPNAIKYRPEMILNEMMEVQRDIARRALAIKALLSELELTEGIAEYPLDLYVYKIREFFKPDSWTAPIEIVNDSRKWNTIVSNPINTSYPQPLWVIAENRSLIFHPAPSADVTVSLWIYREPVEPLVRIGNPEVFPLWDNALEFGTTGRILESRKANGENVSGADWISRYENEVVRRSHEEMNEGNVQPARTTSFSDDNYDDPSTIVTLPDYVR